jgi:hypothetical protein
MRKTFSILDNVLLVAVLAIVLPLYTLIVVGHALYYFLIFRPTKYFTPK